MENNNIIIPSIEYLQNRWEKHNKKFWGNDQVDIIWFQQIIDVLEYSKDFLEYLYNNWYKDNFYLSYVIYWQIVHYMKYCYDNQNYNEIKKMLEFIDKKMKNEDEYINTLAQVWVLENLDIYPDMLHKVLELMPKYSKSIFLRHYSYYLS